MELLKTITGKVVGGLMAIIAIIAVISWFRMDGATKDALLSGSGRILAWFAVVILFPWATFFIIGWVAKFNTNAAGGALVLVYTALEAVYLLWMFGWSLPGNTAWSFYVVGTLVAGVYNLLICDWIAEKVCR